MEVTNCMRWSEHVIEMGGITICCVGYFCILCRDYNMTMITYHRWESRNYSRNRHSIRRITWISVMGNNWNTGDDVNDYMDWQYKGWCVSPCITWHRDRAQTPEKSRCLTWSWKERSVLYCFSFWRSCGSPFCSAWCRLSWCCCLILRLYRLISVSVEMNRRRKRRETRRGENRRSKREKNRKERKGK